MTMRVWLTCTGCEEVQHYGAIDFFRRQRAEMRQPVTIAFEMLGCKGPAWLVKEGRVIPSPGRISGRWTREAWLWTRIR